MQALAGRVPGRPAGTRHRVAAPSGRRRPDRFRAPGRRRHPHGPLAWWVKQAREDTAVPVPDGVPEVTWGRLRGAALEGAERRGGQYGAARPAPYAHATRGRARPAGAPAGGTRPAGDGGPRVVRDDGPRLRAVVDTVQAQTYDGWELVVVDDGLPDDTAAVLAVCAYDRHASSP